MTEAEIAVLNKLLDNQKEMLDVLGALAESQMLLTEALCPQVTVTMMPDDDPGPTLQ